ncbi:hypothetical protein AJ80_03868 [Polytolypa hystricis UAMH7299]|uniref:Transcription factor domain-containing protein n=1 Tax=Polytolypa hystricis (strain UAMH7299) TaxID=1447883 RepID=A0A2B7YER9_POLH7|nr:hypothetical protein AJ80_03868 [Polytolypa hystricis UAMH7299]
MEEAKSNRATTDLTSGGTGDQPRQDSTNAFFFVDGASSAKAKRSHVMKHHIKEKRKEARCKLLSKARPSSASSPAAGLPWMKKDGPPSTHESPVDDHSDHSHGFVPHNGQGSSSSHLDLSPNETHALIPALSPRSQNKLGIFSRPDPFDTLPLNRGEETDRLVDAWMSKLSYWSGQNPHMKVTAFKQAARDPMTFHIVILTYSALYLARINGQGETALSKKYQSKCGPLLEQYMQDTGGLEDGNVAMAHAALALQEARYGSQERGIQFIEAAKRILNRSLPSNPIYLTYTHFISYIIQSQRVDSLDNRQAHELSEFLRRAESLARIHDSPHFHAMFPERREVFQYTAPLHLLVSSGPSPTSIPQEERIWVIESDDTNQTCRTAALIYITIALFDYQNYPERSRRYLNSLVTTVQEQNLHRYPAPESFIWSLLNEDCDSDLKNPQRAWQVNRLLDAVKLLPSHLHFQLHELLLSFLMLKTPDLYISMTKFEEQLWRHVESQGTSP